MPEYFPHAARGFTLVELLIVIAIIGILSSIVMANINGARESAQNNAAFAMVRDMAPLFYDCTSSGYTLQGATATSTGGGAICSSASVSDREWPPLSKSTWQWRQELDTPAGVDAGWLLIAHGNGHYVACEAEVFTCKIVEAELSL